MNLVKDGWGLFMIICALLFVPQEHLGFWFNPRTHDWYGEFFLEGSGQEYILVKNGTSDRVSLGLPDADLLAAARIEDGQSMAQLEDRYLTGGSYAIVSVPRQISRRERTLGSTDFVPKRLRISTEAEDDLNIIFLFLGALLLAALAFSIGLLCYEGRPLRPSEGR